MFHWLIRAAFWALYFSLALPLGRAQSLSKNPEAHRIFLQGESALRQQDFRGARPLFQRASAQYGNAAPAAANIAAALEALSLLEQGDRAQAYRVFKPAELRYEQSPNHAPLEVAYTRWYLARYHFLYKELGVALPLWREAERALAQTPEFPPYAQMAVHRLGFEHFYQLQDFAQALPLLRQIVAIAEREPKPIWKAVFTDKLLIGELFERLQQPDSALAHYQWLLDRNDPALENNPERLGQLNLRLGRVWFSRKNFDLAERYLQAAIAQPIPLKDKSECEWFLANIRSSRRDYIQALDLTAAALLDDQQPQPLQRFREWLHFGGLGRQLPAQSKLKSLYQQIHRVASGWRVEDGLAQIQQNPILHFERPDCSENYNLALLAYADAQKLLAQLPTQEQAPAEIDLLLAEGGLFFEARQFAQAKQRYESALQKMRAIYPDKHPLVSEALRRLGMLYSEERSFNQALEMVEKALESVADSDIEALNFSDLAVLQRIRFPYELLAALGAKAQILHQQALPNYDRAGLLKALKLYELTTQFAQQLRRVYRSDGARFQLAEMSNGFNRQAFALCAGLYAQNQQPEYLQKAFRFAEASKSNVLQQAVQDLHNRPVLGVGAGLLSRESELKSQIAYLEGEIFYETKKTLPDAARLESMQSELTAARKENEALLEELRKNHQKYFSLKYEDASPDLAAVQAALRGNEVLVEYVFVDTNLYALAIRRDAAALHKLPDFPHAATRISQFLFALQKNNFERFAPQSKRLYADLVAPLGAEIVDKTLIIIPDAELAYLPFEALCERAEGSDFAKLDYLILRQAVCYHYSAGLLARSRQPQARPWQKQFLGVAPDFAKLDSHLIAQQLALQRLDLARLDPIPAASAETRWIAQRVHGDTLLGLTATEPRVKSEMAAYQVLHLATHGIVNDHNPLYSNLVFAGEGAEDGLLHVYELYNIELSAELAVLSACNSGTGALQKSEGQVSLAWAFSYAGCSNVAMTLWSVSDVPTQVLMQFFYEGLGQGLPKAEALRQAKLRYLQTVEGAGNAPRFWAGVVLVGNPDALTNWQNGGGSRWYWWVLLGGAVAAAGAVALWRWKK